MAQTLTITNENSFVKFTYSNGQIFSIAKTSLHELKLKEELVYVNYGNKSSYSSGQLILDWTKITSPTITSAGQLLFVLKAYFIPGGVHSITGTFTRLDLVDHITTWLLTRSATIGTYIVTATIKNPAGDVMNIPMNWTGLTVVWDFVADPGAGTFSFVIESA